MDHKKKSYDILLVEDDEDHAELFVSRLGSGRLKNYRLRHVECLSKAYEATKEKEWDLIILDLGLPESKGIETYRLLTRNGSLKLPIVVQTSSEDVELGELAIKEGALDFIAKNFASSHSINSTIQYAIERQRQRALLAQAQSDLRSFAHCAAHDLKAPLGTIGTCAEVVKAELSSMDISDTAREFLDLIEKCANDSVSLVEDLLRFSEFGASVVDSRMTDLSEVVAKAKDHLQQTIVDAEAVVEVDSLPMVEVDPDLILHVLQNLIGNGIKFRNGSAPRIRISSEKKDTYTVVSIEDNGVGIAPEYSERIFEPFKRLTPESGAKEGTGLGLSICKRIIEAHRGKIWVEPAPQGGSIFRFSIP